MTPTAVQGADAEHDSEDYAKHDPEDEDGPTDAGGAVFAAKRSASAWPTPLRPSVRPDQLLGEV